MYMLQICSLFSKFLLNLWGWHWLIKLHVFHVYDFIIYHLYIFIVCFPPPSQVSFHYRLPPLYPLPLPHPTFPPVITRLLSVSVGFFFLCLIPLPFPPSPPTHLRPDSRQSVLCIYGTVFIVFVSLSCSLDSTYKCNHIILFFLWLSCFTYENILQVHPCCHKKDFFLTAELYCIV